MIGKNCLSLLLFLSFCVLAEADTANAFYFLTKNEIRFSEDKNRIIVWSIIGEARSDKINLEFDVNQRYKSKESEEIEKVKMPVGHQEDLYFAIKTNENRLFLVKYSILNGMIKKVFRLKALGKGRFAFSFVIDGSPLHLKNQNVLLGKLPKEMINPDSHRSALIVFLKGLNKLVRCE